MKHYSLLFISSLLLFGCGGRQNAEVTDDSTSDTTIVAETDAINEQDSVLNEEDVVEDTHFTNLMSKVTWSATEGGFKVPNIMKPSPEIYVDDMPASYQSWNYDDVCLAYWPLLGNWATFADNYPAEGINLTDSAHIKTITYSNGTVFSGYTDDGRIWYMSMGVTSGGEVTHAMSLVLIYPKSKQAGVKKLIDMIRKW